VADVRLGTPRGRPAPADADRQRPLRVAYVCAARIPVFGHRGEGAHVQWVLRALDRRGARVDLLAWKPSGGKPADLRRVRVHRIQRGAGSDRAEREQAALGANDGLREVLAALGPFDLIYERYSLWSYAAMEYARDAGIPGLLEVNGARVEENVAAGRIVDQAGAEHASERAIVAASALVAVSEGVARYLRERFDVGDRVHVVPNGVDPEAYPDELVHARAEGERPFTVGYVGAFRTYHGLDTLIDAFALLHERHPGAQLMLVGEGPDLARARRALEGHGLLDATHFIGPVPPHEVPAQLALMDVGVAPYAVSHASYASPLKVLEYMASGLPVVASRVVEQLERLVEVDDVPILFPPGDAPALADALDRLARDPELRERLGAAGRDAVLRRYTWDGVAGRILELADIRA
jgi:glycosyltransferase involved in cell wall biosynthesis